VGLEAQYPIHDDDEFTVQRIRARVSFWNETSCHFSEIVLLGSVPMQFCTEIRPYVPENPKHTDHCITRE
jgi:hypothetical protein